MYSIKMLNIMLTRKYALFEQETKRTDFFLTPFKTCAIHVFDDFDELTVVLPLVVFVDVDGGVHDVKSGSNLF